MSKWRFQSAALIFFASAIAVPQLAVAQNARAGPQPGAAASDQLSQSANASQSKTAPSLAGTWNLNKDQSDNPQEKMQEAGGSGGRGGGMGRRRRGGHGNMMNGLSQLKVEQTGLAIKVGDANGREIAQYSGSGNSPDSGPAAQWHGGQLVSTREGRRGGSMTRIFELSPDGKQLYVTTRIENPRLQQPVIIRFVYDRAKVAE